MSRKERERLTVMVGVTERKLTLMQACALMGVGYRQSERIWKRYQADGDAGLVHRLRGKPGVRRKPPAVRALALACYAEERYADFDPTLMAACGSRRERSRCWRRKQKQRPSRRRRAIRGGGTGWDWGGSIGAESRCVGARCGWRCGTPVGLRYAPASLRPAPPAGETEQRTTTNDGDILS